MNTLFLTGTVLLSVTSSAAVFAQSVPAPTPPSSPAPTAPVLHMETLRLKFSVGETLYYSLTEDTEGNYREPHGKLIPIKSHLEMQMHQTTTALRDTDSAGLVSFGIDSLTATVDKQPPLDTPPDPAVLANLAALIVLPSGKLEETRVNPAFDADQSLPGEDPAHMNALAGLGELPPGPVQSGSRWKSPVFLGLIGEKTTADLMLSGWETKEAATIAVIKQTLRGSFSTPVRPVPSTNARVADGDMKIRGLTSGIRTVRFNVEAGTVESRDSVVWMTVLLTPKNEEGKFTGTPTRMWVKVTSKLVQTAAPAVKEQHS